MSRRLAVLLFAAVLAWLGIGSARAGIFPDEGSAYSACLASYALVPASQQGNVGQKCETRFDNGKNYYFRCRMRPSGGYACSSLGEIFEFPKSQSCDKKSDMLNARFQSNSGSCLGGCQYAPVLGGGESYRTVTIKGVSFTSASRLAPTGQVCTVSAENPQPTMGDEDQCFQDNTLTQCVKKDGSLCTKSSTGKTFCWSPGENGIKASGNEAASKVPEGKEVKVPPVPPANGGDWEKIAEALVTISENKGGTTTTNNSTVNNYGSSYGSKGSGASGNGGAGQSNGGSGDGSGSGGNGEGDGEGDDGAGPPGGAAGDLYTPNGKTVASVFAAFRARVGDSPLIGAVKSFFTVHAGGVCPTFTVQASQYWESMTYDAHCSGDFLAALRAIGWVLMAMAALGAAYWALS